MIQAKRRARVPCLSVQQPDGKIKKRIFVELPIGHTYKDLHSKIIIRADTGADCNCICIKEYDRILIDGNGSKSLDSVYKVRKRY